MHSIIPHTYLSTAGARIWSLPCEVTKCYLPRHRIKSTSAKVTDAIQVKWRQNLQLDPIVQATLGKAVTRTRPGWKAALVG